MTTYAIPRCAVEIYPFEGGKYVLDGSSLIECIVEKRIGDPVGTANILLAPGGPNGQGFPSWAQIITLQSLVIIAMERGRRSNVVFVGVVQEVQEDQKWNTGSNVVRHTRIVAGDWGVWFNDFNWSSLSYLSVYGSFQAIASNIPAEGGLIAVNAAGLNAVNPSVIASGWFGNIMGGASGVLAQTRLNYQGSEIYWPKITNAYFETYPYGATFPMSVSYVANAGSWYSKFAEICDYPFYEILIGTAPAGAWYTDGEVPAQSIPGQLFYSSVLSEAIPAYSGIVCRLNRMPDLYTNFAGTNITYGSQANMSLWQSLPSHSMESGVDFIESTVSLNLTNYFNFFVLNPTNMKTFQFGPQATNTPGVLFYAYAGAANISGIHRFGIRSMVKDTKWLSDPNMIAMQSKPSSFADLIGLLTTRMASYYTPIPVMENASVSMPLRPDIFVGSQFSYYPFRQDQEWQFYVTGVTHSFIFGGPSVTQLTLERGLPVSVYADPIFMSNILTGNAQRLNGSVIAGLPAGETHPLQPFGITSQSDIQNLLGEIAKIYVTPGAQ